MLDNQKNIENIDYLCIGHCCHDVGDEGFILGGSASYASIVAQKLGRNPAVFSSIGDDFQFFDTFSKKLIPFYYKSSPETTVFENIYKEGDRIQYLRSRADKIFKEDIPSSFQDIAIVHLCPIADEINLELLEYFSGLKCITIQGLLRTWDENGRVFPKQIEWSNLKMADIVILSDEDIKGMEYVLSEVIINNEHVVLTQGSKGAKVYLSGKEYTFPAYPVETKDATGAGDTFASAYFSQFQKTNDIRESCIYAQCVAAFIVEGDGINNLPDTDSLLERINDYREKHLVGH